MLPLCIGVLLLPAAEVGQFSVQVGYDVLKSGHTATTVPGALAGGLLLGQFSENGTVGLQLSNANLRSGFHRRCVSGEQGEQESNSVPDLDPQGLADAYELPRRGVGVNDRQVHPLPRMTRKRALPLVGNVFQSPFAQVSTRIDVARL